MIGIVASRLVERFHRPVVLVARSQDAWKGSGRSIPRSTCTARSPRAPAHLERFGGHRAAAGLSIRPERVDAFADAFAAHADEHLDAGRPVRARDRSTRSSRGGDLTLDLAEELGRLAPFGLGNPGVDAARPRDARPWRRRRSATGSTCASASASTAATRAARSRSVRARSSTGSAPPGRYDVAFRLKENHWNGTVAPQLVVRRRLRHARRLRGARRSLAECGGSARTRGHPRRGGSSPSSGSTEGGAAPAAARVRDVPGAAPRSGASARRVASAEARA